MKVTDRLPAVAYKSLYCVAFFGHSRPVDLDHKETCESIWRGLVRKNVRALAREKTI